MPKWEYKTLRLVSSRGLTTNYFDESKVENDLNFLGWEGWELVHVMRAAFSFTEQAEIALMKRQVRQDDASEGD